MKIKTVLLFTSKLYKYNQFSSLIFHEQKMVSNIRLHNLQLHNLNCCRFN